MKQILLSFIQLMFINIIGYLFIYYKRIDSLYRVEEKIIEDVSHYLHICLI